MNRITMGHDIYAIKEKQEISYLRMSASEELMQMIFYDIFDAQEFNGGVSGNNQSKEYSFTDVTRATEKLIAWKQKSQEEIQKCLEEYMEATPNYVYDLIRKISGKQTEDGLKIIGETERVPHFPDQAQLLDCFTRITIFIAQTGFWCMKQEEADPVFEILFQ